MHSPVEFQPPMTMARRSSDALFSSKAIIPCTKLTSLVKKDTHRVESPIEIVSVETVLFLVVIRMYRAIRDSKDGFCSDRQAYVEWSMTSIQFSRSADNSRIEEHEHSFIGSSNET